MRAFITAFLAIVLACSASGAFAQAKPGEPEVKKSKSGICHDKSSPWYGRTKHFTPYDSLDACLKSGGRLPKK